MRKALKIFVVILAIGLLVAGVYIYRAMPRIPARPFVKPSSCIFVNSSSSARLRGFPIVSWPMSWTFRSAR